MNACMSDIMINKFTEFKLYTVVNILQKHCDLSGYTVLDGRTIQTESVAHQKNKADKTHSAYSLLTSFQQEKQHGIKSVQ